MTQYKDLINNKKDELEQEKLDNAVSFIEIRYADGKWTTETTGYMSGKTITKYNDKRKKDKVEWH